MGGGGGEGSHEAQFGESVLITGSKGKNRG